MEEPGHIEKYILNHGTSGKEIRQKKCVIILLNPILIIFQ